MIRAGLLHVRSAPPARPDWGRGQAALIVGILEDPFLNSGKSARGTACSSSTT